MNVFKTALAAFLIPMVLVLGACGIESGWVVDKEYVAPYTEQKKVYRDVCTPQIRYVTYYDHNNMPKQRMETYQECHREWTGRYRDVYHEAEWKLNIRDDEGKTGSVKVSEEQYEYYESGDWYEKE